MLRFKNPCIVLDDVTCPGVYRRLRLGRRAEAREVLRLFDLPEVRRVGLSPRWLPVRVAFTTATAGARRKAS